MSQDGSPVLQLYFSAFLPVSLADPRLYTLELDLLAATGADQVVCIPSCYRYVVQADTQSMEQEQGVLVSVVLPNTDEIKLLVKSWAIQVARQLGVNELRFVTQEVQTIDESTPTNNAALQLGFEW